MLNIATPRLSSAEWQDVKAILSAVADCGCGEPAAVGPLRSRIAMRSTQSWDRKRPSR